MNKNFQSYDRRHMTHNICFFFVLDVLLEILWKTLNSTMSMKTTKINILAFLGFQSFVSLPPRNIWAFRLKPPRFEKFKYSSEEGGGVEKQNFDLTPRKAKMLIFVVIVEFEVFQIISSRTSKTKKNKCYGVICFLSVMALPVFIQF